MRPAQVAVLVALMLSLPDVPAPGRGPLGAAPAPKPGLAEFLPTTASWTSDTTLGTAVVTGPGDLAEPLMVSDEAGGFILLWTDYRKPVFDPDLYCQRVNANGDTLWGAGGRVVCDAVGVQQLPTLIADGQGGAFMAWFDFRSDAGYYMQHIGPDGVRRWAANGIKRVNGFNSSFGPKICRDATGGIFLAFAAGAASTQITRIDSLGIKQLSAFPPAEGPVLRTTQSSPAAIVTDGNGGAIVALSAGGDIFAQRVTVAGTMLWNAGGAVVSAATGGQGPLDMVSDGASGAILAWTDSRVSPTDIYAQRMSAAGAPMWTLNGAPLCTAAGTQDAVQLRAQSDGGAVAVWRGQQTWSHYAQRVAGDGSMMWTLDGVSLGASATFGDQAWVAPGAGDTTFVAWTRSDLFGRDVFAQKLDGAGVGQWGDYGATVCHGPGEQRLGGVVGDGVGGAFVSYRDARVTSDPDIHAHHLGTAGLPGPVVGVPWSVRPSHETLRGAPNPARGMQRLSFARPLSAGGRVEVLDVGGRRRVARDLAAGATSWSWDGRGDDGARLESGLYFVRVTDGSRSAVARLVRLE